MKVALHLEGAAISGNERQSILVAERLLARGHTVVASCRGEGPVREALEAAGIATTGVRPRGDLDVWNAARFAVWLRRERTDALMVTSWKRLPSAGAAARLARVPRVVFRMGGVHTIEPGPRGWKHRHALGRWYDAVIANSRVVARHYVERVPGLSPERVPIVPNGIEPRTAAPAPLRAELGLSSDDLLLAAVGVVQRRKGYDLLARALARLDGNVHVAVAGGGSADEVDSLRSQIDAAGVAGRFHVLGHRGDVPAVLAAADAFVMSSRGEGMSVAMLEAMAAGKPVVSTDVGGAWEALAAREGRGAAGWIVPPGDAEALAAAVGEVVEGVRAGSADVRARMEEARWRLAHWFTVERMVDGYERVLAGLPAGGA